MEHRKIVSKSFPLRYTLPLLLLVLGGGLAFLLIAYGFLHSNRRVEADALAELNAIGQGAAERLEYACLNGGQGPNRWRAALVNRVPHLLACEAYDESNHLLGSFVPLTAKIGSSAPLQPADIQLLNAARAQKAEQIQINPARDRLCGAFPFALVSTSSTKSAALVGVVYATMDLRPQKDSEIVRAFQSAAAICAITLLLMLLSWTYLNHWLTHRVAALVAVTREIAQGNLACRASFAPGDELAELALAFNEMAGQLQERTQALRESEERFRRIVETAYEGIFVLNERHHLTFVNRRFAQMLGSTIDALTGYVWRELLFDEDWEAYQNRIVCRQLSNATLHERRLRRKDGGEVWAILSFAVQRDASGAFVGAFGMAADITRSKNVESQLRQAQKMEAFSQLAGGIAHEFNNLLTVIIGCSRLLRSSAGLRPTDVDMADEIYDAGNQAGDLTRQLQLFSRQQPLVRQPTNVNELLREAAEALRAIVGRQIDLELPTVDHVVPEITADRAAIKLVLEHLAANAREAMSKVGRLKLETKVVEITSEQHEPRPEVQVGRFVCLSVTDSGHGMAEAELQHIFEPFFTKGSMSKHGGVGLATVYSIIKQHKGWTEVESVVGEGTTFRIFLPIYEVPQTTGRAMSTDNAFNTDTNGKTILLVEDDSGVRNIAKACLRRHGYNVLEAVNGMTARDVWGHYSASIDLLFTDIILPGEWNGNDLAWQFRQQRPDLKVLYISGYNRDRANQMSQQWISDNFLSKPFDPELLATIVRQMLSS